MAAHTVTGVRRELSADGSHRHVEAVRTADGRQHTRKEVFDSIGAGDTWAAEGGAAIRAQTFCPAARCLATPYLKTVDADGREGSLDALPEC
ncbi:MAG TPA: hypothetical protein VFQ85_14720 [Mycobacteriales bacterium]|nr:hypothetical protein [Mycobacteriales bacterium]